MLGYGSPNVGQAARLQIRSRFHRDPAKKTLPRRGHLFRAKSRTRRRFLRQNIDGVSPSKIVKSGLSHVPQEREVFAQMTVLENIELGACVRKDKGEIKKDFEHVYDYFPILKERRHQVAGLLSGGEQQMLAIARGLMARPKLLLCDEPSAGLAPIIVGRIYKIIRRLNEDGITILLVEQNVQMALKLSDYFYVMRNGQIVFSGSSKPR